MGQFNPVSFDGEDDPRINDVVLSTGNITKNILYVILFLWWNALKLTCLTQILILRICF